LKEGLALFDPFQTIYFFLISIIQDNSVNNKAEYREKIYTSSAPWGLLPIGHIMTSNMMNEKNDKVRVLTISATNGFMNFGFLSRPDILISGVAIAKAIKTHEFILSNSRFSRKAKLRIKAMIPIFRITVTVRIIDLTIF
jgi:hypothetical protein